MDKNGYLEIFKKQEIILNHSQEKAIEEFITLTNHQNSIFDFFFKKKKQLKGIYLYGDVGRGKSTLLNEFFNATTIKKKCKFHFNDFMEHIHAELKLLRENNNLKDPIKKLAKNLSNKFRLICLDELNISDIGNAMIMGRFFKCLIKFNITLVITSNRHPKNLYLGGLQKEYFEEFAKILENNLILREITDETDHRINLKNSEFKVAFHNSENSMIDDLAIDITRQFKNSEQNSFEEKIIYNKNHPIICPKSTDEVAIFEFDQICRNNLSSSDYVRICENFEFIIIKNIPKLKKEDRNEALRFINLIDSIYENGNILIFSSESEINEIYQKGKHSFEFERTISRLHEMQSGQYLAKWL